MKHLFVPYEIALQLKEKGFDEECFGWYWLTQKGAIQYSRCSAKHCVDIPAPLYQQVIDWLKKEKKILIAERRDGWEYGAYEWDDFIYCENINKAIEEALKLI